MVRQDNESGGGRRRVSVSFDAADYEDLRKIAGEKRVSLAWVVRDAVAAYLYRRSPLFRDPPRGGPPAAGPEATPEP